MHASKLITINWNKISTLTNELNHCSDKLKDDYSKHKLVKNRNPTEERIQETRTYVRVHKSHPGLNCLSFSYEELDNGRVVRVRQKRVAVGWSIVWVFGPLNEAEHNGILLPRQRISHRIQSESRRWIREQNSAVATN